MNLKSQLLSLLQDGWKLTGDLAKSNLDFTRFLKTPEKIVQPQVAVGQFIESVEPLGGRTDDFLEVKAKGKVHLQIKSVDQEESNMQDAEDQLDLMIEEVRRILAQETLPSEWDSAYPSEPKGLDPIGSPPLLQNEITVFVYYIKTYGG